MIALQYAAAARTSQGLVTPGEVCVYKGMQRDSRLLLRLWETEVPDKPGLVHEVPDQSLQPLHGRAPGLREVTAELFARESKFWTVEG